MEEIREEPEADEISQRSLSDEFVLVSEGAQAELLQSIAKAVPAAAPDPVLEPLDHRGVG